MNREEWMRYYLRLPKKASEFLLDDQSGLLEDKARNTLGYDYDAWDRVMNIVWDLLFKKDSLGQFQEKCRSLAGDRRPDELEKALLLYAVYPLADLVPWDVETRLQELGISLTEIQSIPRVSIMPVTYASAARRIAALAKVSVFQEELLRRLRDLMVSVITGVRSNAQAFEFLQRKQADGGLGFTSDQAQAYLQAMTEYLNTSTVMNEQEYSEWYRTARLRDQAMWKEDTSEEEPENPNEDTLPAGTVRLKRQYEPVLEKAMNECLQQIGDLGLDDYLEKRLENIISTRLRNVRNAVQTMGVLTRDDKIGGLGLDQEKAERVAKIIEAGYELHHSEIEDDQKRRIQETEILQKQKVQERKQRESEEHAEWYQQKVATPSFTNVMTTQETRQAGQTMAAPPIRPNISGVTAPASQLSDLIGEFKTMDIQEFRRLSKDPDQAGDKLFEKFETLRRESFDRYTAGIAAWRSSPLQQRYLQLVSESFTKGKTVAEVAEANRAQDPNTPTAAELGAIITLNAKIQY